MKKRTLLLTMLLSLSLLLCSCGEEPVEEEEAPSVAVEIQKVEKGSISAQSSVSGQVAAGDQATIIVPLSVRCNKVYVEEGDAIAAGQTICTLDMASTRSNYDTVSMSLAAAQQSYADQSALLEQQVAQAEKNVADIQALFESGAASQLEVDNAQLQLDNAKASMRSALSQLEVSMKNYQSSLLQIQDSLANVDWSGRVKSPISGTIISLSVVDNGFVSAASPVAVVQSASNMEVNVAVSESLVSKLSVGGKVDVSISAAGKHFQGTVKSIDRAANMQTRLYGVTIKVPAAYGTGVLAGMFADVVFYTDTQNDAVVIPTEAIQTGMDGQYVYTLDSENLAHRVLVETGLVGDGVTEVTSGLYGGETLVTVGQFYLSDGATARVVGPGGEQ